MMFIYRRANAWNFGLAILDLFTDNMGVTETELHLSTARVDALRRNYRTRGGAALLGRRRNGGGRRTPAGFHIGALRCNQAVRLRQELAAFRVPRESDMSPALLAAFEALAVCAEEVLERAKNELTGRDLVELLDRMATTRQRSRSRS